MFSEKSFLSIVGVLFGLGAVVHLLRLVMGWPIVLGDWAVPVWVSWLGLLLAGFLAYEAFRLASRSG
jgi:hypothetical protein